MTGAARLRQRWESGERGRVIREVVERWDEILAGDGDLTWLEGALRASGLPREAFAVQVRAVRHKRDAREWYHLVRSLLGSGDPWWARELLDEAAGSTRELDALRIDAQLATGTAATDLIRAWLHQHHDEEAIEAAVAWFVRDGHVEEAERLLAQADGMALWRARFALWRNQPSVARTFLASAPQSAAARCLEGIAAVQEGALEQAEALLRGAGDDAREDTASWLVSVLYRQGRYGEARQTSDTARAAATDFRLVPTLEREIAAVCELAGGDNRNGAPAHTLRQRLALWVRAVKHLEHAPVLYVLGLTPNDPLTKLQAVIDRFGGNHGPHLTTIQDGALRSCRLPPDPRHLGGLVQRVLWTRGADAVRALYRELAPCVEGNPHLRIYEGEVELWMGEYEDAARIFQDALQVNRNTRWAWIGLGASQMLQGDLDRAQKTWRQGLSLTGPGPTLFVYRGECYRRQGDVRRARADLETALREKPERLSARINLALLEGDPERLQQAERDCSAHAPFLMDELRGAPAEKLEQVLEAMRGNRSSSPWSTSYHLWGRLWSRATR